MPFILGHETPAYSKHYLAQHLRWYELQLHEDTTTTTKTKLVTIAQLVYPTKR